MKLQELTNQRWIVAPERFSGLTFLYRDHERILYDTRREEEVLKYTSRRTVRKNDWEELQQLLSEIAK